MSSDDLIQLDGISKRFGGVTALDDVTFGIRRGEVHALVGENGAGKSTLMKLLAGVHPPDRGEIRIDGRAVRMASPRDAQREGVSIVFQELNLFPHRSVAANLFAYRERTGRLGFVRRREMSDEARGVLRTMDVPISPDAIVGSLPVGTRQLVEIARTLAQQSRIIILDEPNSALTEAESQRLFEIIRRLRASGVTILYVSHRMEEVFAISDRISVMRDGRYQGTFETRQTTIGEVIATMIGKRMDQLFPPSMSRQEPTRLVLKARDVCVGERVGPISFDVSAGEILGFAGLEGAGIDELFQALFGLERITAGQVICDGKVARGGSPGNAIRRGWGLIPESRRDQGLLMGWSIARNMALSVLNTMRTRLGLIDRHAVRVASLRFIEQLAIAAENPEMRVDHLSGGNQQKVLLAKWLAIRPTLLMLNDPTRGVDVGAKHEIYKVCRELAAEGISILLASSEADELLGLADRVLVLRQGRIARDVLPCDITKGELIHAMSAAS